MADVAMRRDVLADIDLTGTNGVTFESVAPSLRLILRGTDAPAERAGNALGFPLPRQACRSAGQGSVAALWLGPDEWFVLGPEADAASLPQRLAAALARLPHAMVDVSHRDAGLWVRGQRAAEAINAGCPLDLDPAAFPTGACTRTIFGKAEIVLWRTAHDTFRIETGRSYMRYVQTFAQTAARDLA